MSIETQSHYLPTMRRAIGSSYLIQQSPGAEMVGGLEVVLTKPTAPPGTVRIRNTLWRSDEVRDDLETYQTAALNGIKQYAHENGIDLRQYNIELGRFLVHDIDSRVSIYFMAAQHAFQSALATWHRS